MQTMMASTLLYYVTRNQIWFCVTLLDERYLKRDKYLVCTNFQSKLGQIANTYE